MAGIISALVCGCLLMCLGQMTGTAGAETRVSGRLINGFRVLDVRGPAGLREFTVFRGDYIKFDTGDPEDEVILAIPALGIEAVLPSDLNQAPHFKMKEIGHFDFFIGPAPGLITVVEYTGSRYQAISSAEGAAVIQTLDPLILDVRTPREYASGHLAGAVLIPVRELQRRAGEISAHKDRPVLIYCATGNRSTVASKILIDQGFSRIFNLGKGILDWRRTGLPVTR